VVALEFAAAVGRPAVPAVRADPNHLDNPGEPQVSDMNPYRAQWDNYAKNWKRPILPDRPLGEDCWPGDEWGNEARWSKIFETMFLDFGARNWKNCVEIGPGSGKYTSLLLRNSDSHIVAFDISPAYMEVMQKRLSRDIEDHRLEPALIKAEKSAELLGIWKIETYYENWTRSFRSMLWFMLIFSF